MTRIVTPARARLVYVDSRGWLLAKLGVAALVIAGAILVWGPLVTSRPQAMRLAGWLTGRPSRSSPLELLFESRRPSGVPAVLSTCSSVRS